MKIVKYAFLVFLTFNLSCSRERTHTNPYDPKNSTTGGAGDKGHIIGTVKFVSGTAIQNSVIYLDGSLKTATDSSGNYAIYNVSVGNHTIKVLRNSNATSKNVEKNMTVQPKETVRCDVNFDYNTLSSNLSGSYSDDDYRLALSNSPYTVTDNVYFLSSTNNLIIDDGVTIKFNGAYVFYVYATNVAANGTSVSPVKFTSAKSSPSAGDYGNINFGYGSSSMSSKLSLNYVVFEYGSYINFDGVSSSSISNCTFTNNNSGNVNLYLNGEVRNCNFQKTSVDSICIKGSPIINYCNISGGIRADGNAAQYRVKYNNLTKGSAPILTNNAHYTLDATNNWWGTTDGPTISSYITVTIGTVTSSPYATSSISTAGVQ